MHFRHGRVRSFGARRFFSNRERAFEVLSATHFEAPSLRRPLPATHFEARAKIH
jgi:hypothetical protein